MAKMRGKTKTSTTTTTTGSSRRLRIEGGLPMTTIFLFAAVVAATAAATAHAQQHLGDTFDDEDNELTSIDVQEGDTVKLECRFSSRLSGQKGSTLYWIRTNRNGHDNVAIGDTPFQENYSVDNRPSEGVYDLEIEGATYDRDNGQFECRMKEGGSGRELHSKSVTVTVLLKPSPPKISPASNPTATEGRVLNLTCSSVGGSPPPQVYWYGKEQPNTPLEANLIKGRNKDEPTRSVLSIVPSKENDGSTYRCTVWNRALGQSRKFEASTDIFVNYFPRVVVGPENPLKVEKDETAQLECAVDSKPSVSTVKWTRNGRFIDTHFKHTIPRVTLQDAGSYVCSADNGLGQVNKAELNLDVLYPPIATLPPKREVKEGENVEVECKIASNPRPATIQWYKEGDDKFHQNGPKLRLKSINAGHNGNYVCSATNYVQPTGRAKTARTGNATIAINVRHQPGKAFITPEEPKAVDGKSVSMRCGADPPGFPAPEYRWWKEGSGDSSKTLARGSEFTIDFATLDSAGKYFCRPANELGEGSVASARLDVYQAPKIVTGLQTTIMKRAGDTGFIVTCSAAGKPKPIVSWFKDGVEISAGESEIYQISTSEQVSTPNKGYTVLSTLKFAGQERIGGGQLMPTDRGRYTCQFGNEVAKTDTTMLLRIEHSPVVVHHHNRVAFDLGQTAFIGCRMQAFPAPRFDWTFGNSILSNDRSFYDSNMTELNDDIYEATLKINQVSQSSYGDYICKGQNTMGAKRTIIKLQPRGKPEKPQNVRPVASSYDVITLAWDEGFDGGYDTFYTIQFKKLGENVPRYEDCGHKNPCNITKLEQHTQYLVRVKASNIGGESKFSREVPVVTKVDVAMIPAPGDVHYARTSRTATFSILDTALPLIAKIELENGDGTWSSFSEFTVGDTAYGEVPIATGAEPVSNLRVRFCLEANDVLCGSYTEAKLVEVSPAIGGSGAEPWLIAVVIFIVVAAIMAVILIVKCCCCARNQPAKRKARPDIVHSTQPNPNTSFAANGGFENKGVDTVKDNHDDSDPMIKNNIYSVQNGYQYNGAHTYPEQPQVQNGNSNSNSANGGSVNSQDSLWKVNSQLNSHQPQQQQFNNAYTNQYNPNVPNPAAGYGYPDQYQQQQQPQPQQQQYQDDYAHYPHPDEYLNERSQQFIAQEQYGQIGMGNGGHQQPMYQDDNLYGDVSGLPDPYMGQQGGEMMMPPPQQQQPHFHPGHGGHGHQMPPPPPPGGAGGQFDDSQDEHDFSPNGKSRRIIREIIV